MNRQVAQTAARRLRAARELVTELRAEEDGRERAVRWIESGDWEGRLRRREGRRVCDEVLSGFEGVCEGWRAWVVGGGLGGGAEVEVGG